MSAAVTRRIARLHACLTNTGFGTLNRAAIGFDRVVELRRVVAELPLHEVILLLGGVGGGLGLFVRDAVAVERLTR